MIYFVLLCGGKGSRTGFDEPKQYLKISEKPVFSFSIEISINALKYRDWAGF